ncbi:hypothetical protein BV22DRAFT_1038435 [Leucogyrophana mollusca]|uniref:Uncharacterized protein n=1 Tax=Leucogyrophana mollusca TaxID=85980 RepID=A0ACB8B754_9AGAM|nr:hypothetical protein BV22DRAFT_1038435 [Leucogyrophana mollusca]
MTIFYLMIALVTIVLSFESSYLPVTRCNDPLDPAVRERQRIEWEADQRRHNHEVENRRALNEQWEREDLAREHTREQWQHEVAEHERLEKERRQREVEERQRLGMFWSDLRGFQGCKSYATREYTAQLWNVPNNYPHRIEACMNTPIVIHGVTYDKPTRCVDNGSYGLVGFWEVNHNEPSCSTFWEFFKDKGCVAQGSGKRRYEQFLANIPEGGDWKEFCATTPTSFHGLEFASPHHCFQGNPGAYGLWDVDDSTC